MEHWKTRSAIGTKASIPSLTKPNWFSQHGQPTTLHTIQGRKLRAPQAAGEADQKESLVVRGGDRTRNATVDGAPLYLNNAQEPFGNP